MRDRDFQAKILGIEHPWVVHDVVVSTNPKTIETFVRYEGSVSCPQCGEAATRHDHRERRWRHLDIYEYKAYVVVQVPRIQCPQHGVVALRVPFAEGRSGFTALFERLAISLLREMSISGAARILGISWDEVDGIMLRAVERGLQQRPKRALRLIGIDEKSVKRRHRYFTIVTDIEAGDVVWVGRGHRKETLDVFWRTLSWAERQAIEGVVMDMSEAYLHSTLDALPDARHKIVFDKFHIAQLLTHAVDLERRAAGRQDAGLKHTRYRWLRNPASMKHAEKLAFARLRKEHARVARAWSIKELFTRLWSYTSEAMARRFFARWYGWAVRSRLSQITRVARTLKGYFEHIITYLRIPITNSLAESINSKIQWIKYQARGFRNEDRFERAILFHCGSLDLYPSHQNV